jgi:hypothetical protein
MNQIASVSRKPLTWSSVTAVPALAGKGRNPDTVARASALPAGEFLGGRQQIVVDGEGGAHGGSGDAVMR